MFETSPILWLQSFSSSWLALAMRLASEIGHPRANTALALIVTFGVDFRLGFALLQMVYWSAALDGLLKAVVGLPRPVQTDSRVRVFTGNGVNTTPFVGAGGHRFFDLPSRAVIAYYRAQPHTSFGLPSSHVSVTTAFWVGVATALKSRALAALGALLVFVVALSRMYRGRHFLADALGGLVVGVLIVLAARPLLSRPLTDHLFPPRSKVLWSGRRLRAAGLLVLGPLLFLAFALAVSPRSFGFRSTGRLVGADLAFAVLVLQGVPAERNDWRHRLARVVLVLSLFVVARTAASWFVAVVGLRGTASGEFLRGLLPPPVILLGTIQLGLRFGLYDERRAPAAARARSLPPELGSES